MRRCRIWILLALIVACANASRLLAGARARDDAHAAVADKEKPRKADTLTVAVFDFEANAPGNPGIGKDVADIIRIKLTDKNSVSVVNRADMDKIIREHELNQAGMATGAKALQNGKLVGAKLIITGKVTMSGGKLYIMSSITGTETTLVQGEMVNGGKDADVFELAFKLADQLRESILKNGPGLIPPADAIEDPLAALKRALAGRKLPKVAVVIHEEPVALNPPPHMDPAAETEVRIVLKDAGFTLFEGDEKTLADAGVDLVISGKGFSEFAARIGNLIACTGHANVTIKNRRTGEVLFSDQVTTRGIDLAENTAAKTALEKAGHSLGLDILRHFEKTIPAEKAGK